MKRALLFLSILSFGLLLIGCSSSTEPESLPTTSDDLTNLSATAEEPYFGDANVAKVAVSEDTEFDDPILADPETAKVITESESSDIPDIYCLRIVWGNLAGDADIATLTDWSGKLTVSRGAIVLTHTILFEPGQDYILPRYNSDGFYVPEELGWVSKTSTHFDGIATKLFFPPSTTDDVVTVTYESSQFSISFDINQLEELDSMVVIGPGNAISFRAVRWEPHNDLRGGLVGRWGRDESGQGVFYGKWTNAAGTLIGTLKGSWGVNDNGRNVFLGKWIDNDGNFRGFIRGFYGASNMDGDPNGTGERTSRPGHFWGLIYNAERVPIGQLHGFYYRGEDIAGGYFAGRWCVGCGDNQYVIDPEQPF